MPVKRALAAWDAENWARAANYFEAIARAVPDDAEARWWLARCLNMVGRREEADARFQEAVDLGVHRSRVEYYQAVRALTEKRPAEAEELARSAKTAALEIGDHYLMADAQVVGAKAAILQGHWQEARETYGGDAAELAARQLYGKSGLVLPYDVDRMTERYSEEERKRVNEKPINPKATLDALLKALPADWIHSIAANLGLPQARKVADARAGVVAALSDRERLARLVAGLAGEEQDALRFLLASGGIMARQNFSRRFSDDRGDSFFVREDPPESVLGRLRDRGLVFVGRAPAAIPRGLALVVPAPLRAPLTELLAGA